MRRRRFLRFHLFQRHHQVAAEGVQFAENVLALFLQRSVGIADQMATRSLQQEHVTAVGLSLATDKLILLERTQRFEGGWIVLGTQVV